MEAKAYSRYQRYSPNKVGLILNLIRGKTVIDALKILKFINKAPKEMIRKTIQSALANLNRAKNPEGIYIKECYVTQGPSFKRYRARAFGRAVVYKHRTCHLTVVLSDLKGV